MSGDLHAPPTAESRSFFDVGSPYLKHPLLTADRTAAEADRVVAISGLAAGSDVLDVGCGPGRHSIELVRRGYRVTGIDPASAMIAEAGKRSAEAGVDANWMQLAGEDLDCDQDFDLAICLFTTLGQIGPHGDNTALIGRVAQALRPDGRFVVEVPQRDPAVAALRAGDEFDTDGERTVVTRQFDNGVVTERFEVSTVSDIDRTFLLRYRLFSAAELVSFFEAAGFVEVSLEAGYSGNPLTPTDATMLAIARIQ